METINHECYVSLEIAKLLKEAGFDWECIKIYYNYPENTDNWSLEDNYMNHHNILHVDFALLSPTLDVAQRWLRKIKNVVLLVDFNNDEDCEENERYGVTIYTGKERIIELATYPTYEEAQEAGIKKALEIILEKGE